MPLGRGGEAGGAAHGPELVTDEERKDREGEKKGASSKECVKCFLPQTKQEEGEEAWKRGLEQYVRERGGALPAGQAQAQG